MAARSAKGDTALAKLVRERQDLVGEWQVEDKNLISAKSEPPARRNPDAEKMSSDRLAAIDERLKTIDARFAKDFPEYASLTGPKPVSVAEVLLVKTAPERDAYGNVCYETLPFDTTRANALYDALFRPIEDVIRDKHLLIVPSRALTQLPFQVLITKEAHPALSGTEALRRAAWLVRSHALTVLPSVSSLKALRQLAKESHANRPLIGFGNPLLA
jgi:hypothetical protein